MSFSRVLSVFLVLAAAGSVVAQTPILPLASENPLACNRCNWHLLPGSHLPSPRTVYRIDSDLPELYYTNGVLYSTMPVLPPFETKDDGPVPEEMRTQRNAGFETIDDSFEVFLYHLSQKHTPGETRRIVVYAKNAGDESVTVAPRQAIFHGPNSARPGGVESLLGKAVFNEVWDTPVAPLTIAPGDGAIIGYTKQLGAAADAEDLTRAVFVTGTLRADVRGEEESKPNLIVSTLSIPGQDDRSTMKSLAEEYMAVGSDSGEEWMDLRIPPPECHLRRVVGVMDNVMWQSDPLVFDIAALPDNRVGFQMALPYVQAPDCKEAVQTAPMTLYPPYVRPESIGNYMMEYYLNLTLANSGDAEKTVDLRFGKQDQKIGLVWQMAIGETSVAMAGLEELPAVIGWAGKTSDDVAEPYFDATMLANGPLTIAPGERKVISVRMMVLGTSSLPYQLHLVSQ